MRNLKTGLIALAASAAFLIPATAANASTQSVSTSSATTATTSLDCLLLCKFSIIDDVNVEVLKDIDATTVVNILNCNNTSITAVLALALNGQTACSSSSHPNWKWIKRTH